MGRLSKDNPFKHESRNKKKRKARHADRYAEEQRTLDALEQGNYHVPIADVDHQPPQAEIDIDYSMVDTHDIRSAWGSIPWDVISPSNVIQPSQSRYLLLDPSFIAAARARDRDIDAQILADNRKKAMSKLFTSYLCLREKTGSWTSESSFEDFSPRFCKCDESARRMVAWIDLVDLTGQQRVKFKFCDCMPRFVQVLANGFWPVHQSNHRAAFSMRLLAYHNYAWHHSNVRMKPFAETQRVFSEERSEFLWNKNMTGPVILTIYTTGHPAIFVQPSELEDVKEYITQQERLHKITKKANKCADSHKAGNDVRYQRTRKDQRHSNHPTLRREYYATKKISIATYRAEKLAKAAKMSTTSSTSVNDSITNSPVNPVR
ncbi:hypothetical protein H4Q26_009902, partial [Puccinia striiformis f. sp. tritici PST-130]